MIHYEDYWQYCSKALLCLSPTDSEQRIRKDAEEQGLPTIHLCYCKSRKKHCGNDHSCIKNAQCVCSCRTVQTALQNCNANESSR